MHIHWSREVAAAVLGAAAFGIADAQVSDDVVKIGVIVDMSGVYSDNGGIGVVQAVEMAVKDFGGAVQGKPIRVCPRRPNFDPPCRSNIDPGMDADRVAVSCG